MYNRVFCCHCELTDKRNTTIRQSIRIRLNIILTSFTVKTDRKKILTVLDCWPFSQTFLESVFPIFYIIYGLGIYAQCFTTVALVSSSIANVFDNSSAERPTCMNPTRIQRLVVNTSQHRQHCNGSSRSVCQLSAAAVAMQRLTYTETVSAHAYTQADHPLPRRSVCLVRETSADVWRCQTRGDVSLESRPMMWSYTNSRVQLPGHVVGLKEHSVSDTSCPV